MTDMTIPELREHVKKDPGDDYACERLATLLWESEDPDETFEAVQILAQNMAASENGNCSPSRSLLGRIVLAELALRSPAGNEIDSRMVEAMPDFDAVVYEFECNVAEQVAMVLAGADGPITYSRLSSMAASPTSHSPGPLPDAQQPPTGE